MVGISNNSNQKEISDRMVEGNQIQNWVVSRHILLEGNIKSVNKRLKFRFMGKELNFEDTGWEALPLNEIFVKKEYGILDVKDRIVIDIGSSIGDSPIYFAMRGAKKVYGYEINLGRLEESIRNIVINGFSDRIEVYPKHYDGKVGDVLKMDCEGCEYNFDWVRFGSFKEIILEYHNGNDKIREQLTLGGYNLVDIPKNTKEGILWAKKKK